MVSFKTAVSDTLGPVDMTKGIMASLLNPFYKGNPEAFPYQRTILSLIKTLEWPQSTEQVEEYPAAGDPGWSEELNGVTNNGNNWFISQKWRIWKFPIGHDLNEEVDEDDPPAGILSTGIPQPLKDEGYDHFGDLDHYKGFLYVALEGHVYVDSPDGPISTDAGIQPRIAVFDAHTLAYVSSALLDSSQPGAPWCAINPLNGRLYSSFDNSNHLFVYDRIGTPNALKLHFLGDFGLKSKGHAAWTRGGISGGVFSKNGHLYLITNQAFFNDIHDFENDGIFGFDMITGLQIKHTAIPFNPNFFEAEELEGVTILDLDSGMAPNIRGQIHVIMLDNDLTNDDDIYFKHFKVSEIGKI